MATGPGEKPNEAYAGLCVIVTGLEGLSMIIWALFAISPAVSVVAFVREGGFRLRPAPGAEAASLSGLGRTLLRDSDAQER